MSGKLYTNAVTCVEVVEVIADTVLRVREGGGEQSDGTDKEELLHHCVGAGKKSNRGLARNESRSNNV